MCACACVCVCVCVCVSMLECVHGESLHVYVCGCVAPQRARACLHAPARMSVCVGVCGCVCTAALQLHFVLNRHRQVCQHFLLPSTRPSANAGDGRGLTNKEH